MINYLFRTALRISLFGLIILFTGCTADGAWDLLSLENGGPGPGIPDIPVIPGIYDVTLISSQDTSINGDTIPTDKRQFNYGNCDYLTTNQSNGSHMGEVRVLVMFDLSSIHPSAIINSAEFKLTKTGGVDILIAQHIHKLSEPWTEGFGDCGGLLGVANWDYRMPGVTWGSGPPIPGGVYDSSPFISVDITVEGEYIWTGGALRTLVDEWHKSVTPNYGLIVGSPDLGTDDRFFASRENPTASDRPKLVINYTIP
jgi:hypothetical protein